MKIFLFYANKRSYEPNSACDPFFSRGNYNCNKDKFKEETLKNNLFLTKSFPLGERFNAICNKDFVAIANSHPYQMSSYAKILILLQ